MIFRHRIPLHVLKKFKLYIHIYIIFTNVLNHTNILVFFFFLLLPLAGSLISVLVTPGALPSNPTIIHPKQLDDILSYFYVHIII